MLQLQTTIINDRKFFSFLIIIDKGNSISVAYNSYREKFRLLITVIDERNCISIARNNVVLN